MGEVEFHERNVIIKSENYEMKDIIIDLVFTEIQRQLNRNFKTFKNFLTKKNKKKKKKCH